MALVQKRPKDLDIYNQETDLTPIAEVITMVDHPTWTEPKQASGIYVPTTTPTEILLGGNIISSSGWTFADWTGNETIGFTHSRGTIETYSFVGGSGYAVGQILTAVQTGGSGGTFTINTVDGTGVILTMTKTTKGVGYSAANSLSTTVNTGTGINATISILTVGNTTALSNVLAAIIDVNYQLQITVTGRTAGSFVVAFGGDTSIALNSSGYYVVLATTNGNLIITPTSDFNGTIIIAIKKVVWKLSSAELLAVLGVPDVVTSTTLLGYVTTVDGKSLILNTEITRLLTLKQNVYKIDLPAGATIAARLLTATLPVGWVFTAVGDTGKNLQIVHTLTGRSIAHVNVKVIDPITKGRMLVPFRDAYSGIVEDGLTLTVQGLAPNNLPLVLILIFY